MLHFQKPFKICKPSKHFVCALLKVLETKFCPQLNETKKVLF